MSQIKKYSRLDLDKLKNPYLDIKIAKQAEEKDSTAGSYVIVLCKFGICGVSSTGMLYSVISLLNELKIKFNCNKKGVIWLDTLEKSLINFLSN